MKCSIQKELQPYSHQDEHYLQVSMEVNNLHVKPAVGCQLLLNLHLHVQFSSVQSLSHVRLFGTP